MGVDHVKSKNLKKSYYYIRGPVGQLIQQWASYENLETLSFVIVVFFFENNSYHYRETNRAHRDQDQNDKNPNSDRSFQVRVELIARS